MIHISRYISLAIFIKNKESLELVAVVSYKVIYCCKPIKSIVYYELVSLLLVLYYCKLKSFISKIKIVYS